MNKPRHPIPWALAIAVPMAVGTPATAQLSVTADAQLPGHAGVEPEAHQEPLHRAGRLEPRGGARPRDRAGLAARPVDVLHHLLAHPAFLCAARSVDGRYGWRLPALPELMSLMVRGDVAGPALPAGHPFGDASGLSGEFWTSDRDPTLSTNALTVTPVDGATPGFVSTQPAGSLRRRWCVRGGIGANPW